MNPWETIYKEYENKRYESYNILTPHKDFDKVIKIFKDKRVKRVLDLGCGIGRHIKYLAQRGFEVYGIDGAKKAIEITAQILQKSHLRAKLRVGDMFERLPYKNSFFDAIISIQVLHHEVEEKIKKSYI
jgi:2-polyprenyl-3-methyl-5-hydroxy-6-metoxy-1,4-benzoquinol methylase